MVFIKQKSHFKPLTHSSASSPNAGCYTATGDLTDPLNPTLPLVKVGQFFMQIKAKNFTKGCGGLAISGIDQ